MQAAWPVIPVSRVSMKLAALAIPPTTAVARRVDIGDNRAALTGIRKTLNVNMNKPY